MSEVKKIPTMSWLIRKANALLKKDAQEYGRLCTQGTDKLLRGCRVRMATPANGHQMAFVLEGLSSSFKNYPATTSDYATITCHRHKGEFYTFYTVNATTSKYRKRMHKWLPVSLPEGMKCGDETSAEFYNADGTKALDGKWYGGRRLRTGSPSTYYLVIRDRDGKFINYMDQSVESRAATEGYHASNPADLWHGFVPGSVDSKMDWYASMVPPQFENFELGYDGTTYPSPGPLWNADRVRSMAARVHADAIRLTKNFPYIRLALFPGGPWGKEKDDPHAMKRFSRFSNSTRKPVVIGRDSKGEPLMWMLPELIAYWTVSPAETHNKYYHEPRYVRVVIPPVGSEQLLRKSDLSYITATYRHGPSSDSRRFKANVSSHGKAVERACHQLIALRIGSEANGQLFHADRYRNCAVKLGTHPLDEKIHDWDQNQKAVIVYDSIDTLHTYRTIEPTAANPEGVFSKVWEKELVNSLPLC